MADGILMLFLVEGGFVIVSRGLSKMEIDGKREKRFAVTEERLLHTLVFNLCATIIMAIIIAVIVRLIVLCLMHEHVLRTVTH